MAPHLVIIGLGYSGRAVARLAAAQGLRVTALSRRPASDGAPDGIAVRPFDDPGDVLASADCLLTTAPPDQDGDPVLRRHGAAIAAAPRLRWIGVLSTTGVYGDRGGAWVNEATPPRPGPQRARRRVAAELAWMAVADDRPIDLFRLAGIYGPGRSAFDDLRAGRARRVLRPGHVFGRIHRDDIARAVIAAIAHPPDTLRGRRRVLNGADLCPAEPAAVIAEAAALLGLPPPPAVPFAQAWTQMSPMARSFWAESRRVGSCRTRRALGLNWLFPSYRQGLRAILAEEQGLERSGQQSQIDRA